MGAPPHLTTHPPPHHPLAAARYPRENGPGAGPACFPTAAPSARPPPTLPPPHHPHPRPPDPHHVQGGAHRHPPATATRRPAGSSRTNGPAPSVGTARSPPSRWTARLRTIVNTGGERAHSASHPANKQRGRTAPSLGQSRDAVRGARRGRPPRGSSRRAASAAPRRTASSRAGRFRDGCGARPPPGVRVGGVVRKGSPCGAQASISRAEGEAAAHHRRPGRATPRPRGPLPRAARKRTVSAWSSAVCAVIVTASPPSPRRTSSKKP